MPEKSQDLPAMEGEGVAPRKIKAVDELFDSLLGARSNRMKWAKKEKEVQTDLIALMEKHELQLYVFDDRVYILADIKKVKLKPKDEEDDGD